MPHPPAMSASRTKLFAFAAVAVLLFLLLAEAALWLVGFEGRDDFRFIVRRVDNDLACPDIVEDRTLFWKLRPNAKFDLDRAPVRSNADGFRTPDVAAQPAPGVRRIVFLGDSTTFGWRVAERERYSDALVRMLEATFPKQRFEAINLGVPGYTSFQARRAFETFGCRYKPQLVVVCVGTNDMRPAYAGADAAVARRIERSLRPPRGLARLRLYALMRKVVNALRPKPARSSLGPRVSPRDYERNIVALAEQCKRIGAKLIVLNAPRGRRMGDSPDKKWRPYRTSAARAASHGRAVLVQARSMTEESMSPNGRLFCDVAHPNAAGHMLLAAHVFDAVLGMGWLPRADARAWDSRAGCPRREAALARALVAAHASPTALPSLIDAYSAIGAYEDALLCARRVKCPAWDSAAGCVALARAYWGAGQPHCAIEAAERALDIAPDSEPAKQQLEALELALHPPALRTPPTTAKDYEQAICWALDEKDFARAAALAQAATAKHPDFTVFAFWHGEALQRMERFEPAAHALLQLAGADGLHADARLAAAQCLAELGDERAVDLARAAAKLAPWSRGKLAVASKLAERAMRRP